jgi:hypothetical protein
MPEGKLTPNQRLTQTPSRDTEGRHHTPKHDYKAAETQGQRSRGRPKGSRNQPKALIPKEHANEILGLMKDMLPPEHFAEMRDAIRKGKNISTIHEAKILMKLMGPPVWMRLAREGTTPEEVVADMDDDLVQEIGASPKPKVQPFDKDLTERIKVLMGLIQLVDRMEKDDEGTNNSAQPIIEIFAGRGISGARFTDLTGRQRSLVGGNTDGTGGETITIRALPDTIPQRSIDVQDSEQVETVGIFNDDIVGDDTRGSDPE